MFSTHLTSTATSRTARSSRQSGLKKPRPLRSVSLPQGPSDKDVKPVPERQMSSGYPASSEMVSPNNDMSISEGIAAMSAMYVAQAEAEASKDYVADPNPSSDVRRFSYDRQDSNSSYNSHAESESDSSFSRQNSHCSRDKATYALSSFAVQQHSSTPQSFKSIKAKANRPSALDVNSNNLHSVEDYKDTSLDITVSSEDFGNVPLAVLLTKQGEKLILTGRNMPTILNAAKILVREMGASIISLRVEDLNSEESVPTETKSPSDNSLSSDYEPEDGMEQENRISLSKISNPPRQVDNKASGEQQSKKACPVIRYSKEELLAFSECEVARHPPANWNILIHTHSDCCLPADKMKEYFEVVDFHSHDGTLVTEDRRVRQGMK